MRTKKRFQTAVTWQDIFLLPCIGIVTHPLSDYPPRICFAWLWWRVSFGIGRGDGDA